MRFAAGQYALLNLQVDIGRVLRHIPNMGK